MKWDIFNSMIMKEQFYGMKFRLTFKNNYQILRADKHAYNISLSLDKMSRKLFFVVLVKNSLGRDLEQRTNCCIAQNLSSNYTVRLKISFMMNVCV